MNTLRNRYHPVSIVLHWVIALLVVLTAILGFSGAEFVSNKAWIGKIFFLHKSLGLSVFALSLLRLIVRISYEMTPPAVSHLEHVLSKGTQMVMYFLLIAIPISGYMVSNAGGHEVQFFSLKLPHLFPVDKGNAHLAGEFHEIAAYIFVAIFIIHALMAVKHLLIDKVNLFRRII